VNLGHRRGVLVVNPRQIPDQNPAQAELERGTLVLFFGDCCNFGGYWIPVTKNPCQRVSPPLLVVIWYLPMITPD